MSDAVCLATTVMGWIVISSVIMEKGGLFNSRAGRLIALLLGLTGLVFILHAWTFKLPYLIERLSGA